MKIIKIFFIIFIVGLILALVLIYININKTDIQIQKQHLNIDIKKPKEELILKKLSSLDNKNYSLPIREVYLDWKINRDYIIGVVYELSIRKLNFVTFFGIKQIFDFNNIKYSIWNKNKKFYIYVYLKNKTYLNQLKKMLESYNIQVEIKQILLKR